MSLLKSILKRLASSIVVLLGLTIIIFILMRIVPGDPARLALGANVSEEVLENYREINHLNDSLPMQYVYWISGAIRGDFGMSAVTKRAVIQDIKDFARRRSSWCSGPASRPFWSRCTWESPARSIKTNGRITCAAF